jgi:predicted phage terminase large subunit-like protein
MRPSLEPAPTIDARSIKTAEREHSKSVTKIGLSSGKCCDCDDGLAVQSSSDRRSSRSALPKTAGIILMRTGSLRYEPDCDKIMRMNAQTAIIENGFVHIPESASWLAEYLHEMTVFPRSKHDDQVDSTAQFLEWFQKPFRGQGYYEYLRQRAQEIEERRKPKPIQPTYARGSMEWAAAAEEIELTEATTPPINTLPQRGQLTGRKWTAQPFCRVLTDGDGRRPRNSLVNFHKYGSDCPFHTMLPSLEFRPFLDMSRRNCLRFFADGAAYL